MVGLAAVGELEFDLGFVGADGHHVVERPVEGLRTVEGEETRLQERGLPAAVGAVDDRHALVESQVRLLVALEVRQADVLEFHR